MWCAWILLDLNLKILHLYSDRPTRCPVQQRYRRGKLLKTRLWKYNFHPRSSKQTENLFIYYILWPICETYFRQSKCFPFFTTEILKKHNEMPLCISELYFTGRPALFSRLFTLSGPWHTPCIHYSKQTQGCLAIKANYFGFFVTVAVLLHGWRLIRVKLKHGFLPGLSL